MLQQADHQFAQYACAETLILEEDCGDRGGEVKKTPKDKAFIRERIALGVKNVKNISGDRNVLPAKNARLVSKRIHNVVCTDCGRDSTNVWGGEKFVRDERQKNRTKKQKSAFKVLKNKISAVKTLKELKADGSIELAKGTFAIDRLKKEIRGLLIECKSDSPRWIGKKKYRLEARRLCKKAAENKKEILPQFESDSIFDDESLGDFPDDGTFGDAAENSDGLSNKEVDSLF